MVRSVLCDIKSGILLTCFFLSDDKDAIVLKRNELVKMKKNHTTVIRGELSSQQSASPPAVLSVLNDNNKRQAEDKVLLIL